MPALHQPASLAQDSKSQVVPKCPTNRVSDATALKAVEHKSSAADTLRVSASRTSSPEPAQTGHPATNSTLARTSRDIPGLSERQLRALDLLAEGTSDSQVAITLNVDRRTIYRWRRHPVFRRELDRLISDLRGVAKERLHFLLPAAFETIQYHLSTRTNGISLRAAEFVIRTAVASCDEAPEKSQSSGISEELIERLFGVPGEGK